LAMQPEPRMERPAVSTATDTTSTRWGGAATKGASEQLSNRCS
jgi:hypothetical protein